MVNRKVGVNTSGWLEEGFLSWTISAELDGVTHKYAFTHRFYLFIWIDKGSQRDPLGAFTLPDARTHKRTHSHNQRDSQMGALRRSDKKGAKVRNVEHSCHGNATSTLPARRTRFRSSATCANPPQSPWGKQEGERGSWGARKWLPIHLDEQQHRLQLHINLLWLMRPS